jgi:hypothetical protein
MVAHGSDVALYQERGADLIVSSVEELLDVLANTRVEKSVETSM